MKKLLVAICLFTFTYGYSQKKGRSFKSLDAKVTAVSYSVSSIEELETIDWESAKEFFSENEDDVEIKMSFEIDLKESKYKIKAKFSVGGESQEIDSLIVKSKKGIKGLIKLATKYKNK